MTLRTVSLRTKLRSECPSPPLSMFVVSAEVMISTTNALEQQNGHEVMRLPFDQSVFFVAVDVHCVFCVDNVFPLQASAVTLYATSLQLGPSPVCGLVRCAMQVHSRPHVHSLTLS